MEELQLYQWTACNGSKGHVSGYDESDAYQRLAKRGITADEVKPLEDGDTNAIADVAIAIGE